MNALQQRYVYDTVLEALDYDMYRYGVEDLRAQVDDWQRSDRRGWRQWLDHTLADHINSELVPAALS